MKALGIQNLKMRYQEVEFNHLQYLLILHKEREVKVVVSVVEL